MATFPTPYTPKDSLYFYPKAIDFHPLTEGFFFLASVLITETVPGLRGSNLPIPQTRLRYVCLLLYHI
jgi:hypothetical protein